METTPAVDVFLSMVLRRGSTRCVLDSYGMSSPMRPICGVVSFFAHSFPATGRDGTFGSIEIQIHLLMNYESRGAGNQLGEGHHVRARQSGEHDRSQLSPVKNNEVVDATIGRISRDKLPSLEMIRRLALLLLFVIPTLAQGTVPLWGQYSVPPYPAHVYVL